MPVAMPISVRREGDYEGGNRFVAARFAEVLALHPGAADPVRRV